jgi:heterodisulfide reductase subunit C
LQSETTKSSADVKLVTETTPKKNRLDFVQEVQNLPGGENILECIQCGLCAGSCPARFEMDYSPTQILKMINMGMREEVLSSYTIWKCTTCHTCATRCPRGIDFTVLMMSLRNLAIKEKLAKSEMKPKFHKSFFEVVNKYGRLNEPTLLMKIIKKSDPKALAHNASLGLRLARKGKIRLRPEKIDHTADLETMLKKTTGGNKK